MKAKLFSIFLTFIVFSIVSLPNTFAQYAAHTQFSLPEGAKARFGKGIISELTYSPDGSLLAVGSSIGICLYDTETSQEVAVLAGHADLVFSASFSPDGTTLASGSGDGTIRLWGARHNLTDLYRKEHWI